MEYQAIQGYIARVYTKQTKAIQGYIARVQTKQNKKPVWWHTLVIPAFGRQRNEDQEFKVILDHIVQGQLRIP